MKVTDTPGLVVIVVGAGVPVVPVVIVVISVGVTVNPVVPVVVVIGTGVPVIPVVVGGGAGVPVVPVVVVVVVIVGGSIPSPALALHSLILLSATCFASFCFARL